MKSTSHFEKFVTCLKIIVFNFLVLTISFSANAIPTEFQDVLESETVDSHQIARPNPEIQYYVPDQKKLKDEKLHHLIPSSAALSPSSYKHTLAYIGKSIKSVHDKSEYDSHGHAQPKLVPTSSGRYVLLAKSIPHRLQTEEKKYKYGYRVSDPHKGAEFGHSETHDGNTVKGYYHVLLPDGRLQTVDYWAGSSGYHASISYDNKHY